MKDKFSRFLHEQDLLPIDSDRWNVFKIEHTGIRKNGISTKINEEFHNGLGIYVYERHGNIYYIGQGKLAGRVRQHYVESYRKTNREKHKKWYMFFSSNLGLFNIY